MITASLQVLLRAHGGASAIKSGQVGATGTRKARKRNPFEHQRKSFLNLRSGPCIFLLHLKSSILQVEHLRENLKIAHFQSVRLQFNSSSSSPLPSPLAPPHPQNAPRAPRMVRLLRPWRPVPRAAFAFRRVRVPPVRRRRNRSGRHDLRSRRVARTAFPWCTTELPPTGN